MNRPTKLALTLALLPAWFATASARELSGAAGPAITESVIANSAPTMTTRGQSAPEPALAAARKRLLDPSAIDWKEAAICLAAQPNGRPLLEEIIIYYRATDNARWTDAFAAYAQHVRPGDVADRMLPEYLADLTLQQSSPGAVSALNRIADFGVRGQSALPMLQWVQSFSRDAHQVAAAAEAIRRVNGGRPLRLRTGC
jgi:hypothetical protein